MFYVFRKPEFLLNPFVFKYRSFCFLNLVTNAIGIHFTPCFTY